MQSTQPLLFPPFRLDPEAEQLWYESYRVPLRAKTFAVLRYLVEQAGRLVTREELLRAVWPGMYVSRGLLREYIRELREVLEDDAAAPRFIETVIGRGYRFIAPLTTAPPVVGSPKLATENWQLGTRLVGRELELRQLHVWLE